MWSQIKKKVALFATSLGHYNWYFLCKWRFAYNCSLDFEQWKNFLCLWAKYKPIWLDFTVKTLIFSKLKIVYCSSKSLFCLLNLAILAHILPTGRGKVIWHTLFFKKLFCCSKWREKLGFMLAKFHLQRNPYWERPKW
jgi:hypothetical protein